MTTKIIHPHDVERSPSSSPRICHDLDLTWHLTWKTPADRGCLVVMLAHTFEQTFRSTCGTRHESRCHFRCMLCFCFVLSNMHRVMCIDVFLVHPESQHGHANLYLLFSILMSQRFSTSFADRASQVSKNQDGCEHFTHQLFESVPCHLECQR